MSRGGLENARAHQTLMAEHGSQQSRSGPGVLRRLRCQTGRPALAICWLRPYRAPQFGHGAHLGSRSQYSQTE